MTRLLKRPPLAAWDLKDNYVIEPVGRKVEGRYQKGRASVDEWLEQTSIANPHVQLTYLFQVFRGERSVERKIVIEVMTSRW